MNNIINLLNDIMAEYMESPDVIYTGGGPRVDELDGIITELNQMKLEEFYGEGLVNTFYHMENFAIRWKEPRIFTIMSELKKYMLGNGYDKASTLPDYSEDWFD